MVKCSNAWKCGSEMYPMAWMYITIVGQIFWTMAAWIMKQQQPTWRQPISRTSMALDSECQTARLLYKQAIMHLLSCQGWLISILLLTHGPVVSSSSRARAAYDYHLTLAFFFHSHHTGQRTIAQGSHVCITEWNNKHCLVLWRKDRINRAIKWLCKVEKERLCTQKAMTCQHSLVV